MNVRFAVQVRPLKRATYANVATNFLVQRPQNDWFFFASRPIQICTKMKCGTGQPLSSKTDCNPWLKRNAWNFCSQCATGLIHYFTRKSCVLCVIVGIHFRDKKTLISFFTIGADCFSSSV